MSQAVTGLTERLQEGTISDLRGYFNDQPDQLFLLFEQYVNNQEWVAEHPLLSLKAFTLLDPETQQREESLRTLRTIFAADVLIKDPDGLIQKILKDAVQNKNWELIFKLIEYGVSKNIRLKERQSLLHMACVFSSLEAALRLLELEVDIGIVDDRRNSPLHLAVGNGLCAVAAVLLERGADPLAVNEEGRTPLHYACIMAEGPLLESFKARFQASEWEMCFAASLQDVGKEEQAAAVVRGALDTPLFGSCLSYALHFPNLMKLLMERFREALNQHLEAIRECSKSLTFEQKLGILPLLHPAAIVETVALVPARDVSRRLRQMVVVEEVPDDFDIKNTVEGALREVDEQWLPFIEWNNEDLSSNSGYLTGRLSSLLARIELATLSIAAREGGLSPIVEKCLPIMDFDQAAVVIPHISLEGFHRFVAALPVQRQIVVLKSATDCQKLHFIKKMPMPCDAGIYKWHRETNEYFWRGIETLIDMRYLKKTDPRPIFSELLAKYEEVTLSLPLAVKRDQILLQTLKGALLSNSACIDVQRFVNGALDAMIYRNDTIAGQLERIRWSLHQDPLYRERAALLQTEPPDEFLCGIYQLPMQIPVTAHGHTFEKEAIATWLENHSECPICRVNVAVADFKENEELKARIDAWRGDQGK